MTQIDELKELLDSGKFHHATYRNQGTLWEGLWIYVNDPSGFRGYREAFCFNASAKELDEAFNLVRGTGISLGSYGKG
jgi:hypothetical protein